MFERFVERRAEEALLDTPVVLIVGPRRAGKTTLVRKMGEADRTYITLDDQTVLEAAQADPAGFIRGLNRAIIDEIQRAPDLLLAIKKTVDEDYRPGRFLLTGSANVLTLPRVADSLAGRMETLRMLPLAKAEIDGQKVELIASSTRLETVRDELSSMKTRSTMARTAASATPAPEPAVEEKAEKPDMLELVTEIAREYDFPIAKTEDVGHRTTSKCLIIGKNYSIQA